MTTIKEYIDQEFGYDNWILSSNEYQKVLDIAAKLAEELGVLHYGEDGNIYEAWDETEIDPKTFDELVMKKFQQ